MDQIHLDPEDKLPPHPPPLGHIVNKTPSTHRTKKCLRPTHPLRIISGTTLNYYIKPHLNYCSSIWGQTSQDNLNTINRLQTQAARLILDKDYNTTSGEMLKELEWQTFSESVQYQQAYVTGVEITKWLDTPIYGRYVPVCQRYRSRETT